MFDDVASDFVIIARIANKLLFDEYFDRAMDSELLAVMVVSHDRGEVYAVFKFQLFIQNLLLQIDD